MTDDPAPAGGLRLWGGRFAGGPAEALARLSVSVQFDWRLAPYDLAGSRAHARVLHRAGLLDDDELARMLGRPGRAGGRRAGRHVHGRRSTTRTCTPRWNAACWSGSARSAASCAPAAAATTRSPPTCGSTCATRARQLAGARGRAGGGAGRPGRASTGDVPMPGMTHLQHAQPVLFAHHLLAHVHALARDLDRLRDWDRRAAVSPLGAGALAGSSLPLDPERDRAGARLPLGRRRTRSTRSRDRDFVAEFLLRHRPARRAPVPDRRGDLPLGDQRVPLDPARRRYSTGSSIMPQKKNPDVAELARGKAGRLIGGLTGLLVDAQGPAAGLRPGPAGGQGAGLRRGRAAAARAARAGRAGGHHDASTRPGWRAAAPEGFALATDVAEWLVRHRGAVPGGARGRRRAAWRYCEGAGKELTDLTDAELAAVDARLTPGRPGGARRARRAAGPIGPRRHRAGPGRRAAGRADPDRAGSPGVGGEKAPVGERGR